MLQYSTPVRNAQLDQVEVVAGTSVLFRLYTGAPPANCAASEAGTLLVELPAPSNWMADAANGQKALASAIQAQAIATGAAGHFRIYDSAGITCHVQGTVSQTGGGGDLTLDNNSIAVNQVVKLNSFTLVAQNA